MKRLCLLLIIATTLCACSSPQQARKIEPPTQMNTDQSINYIEDMGFTNISNVNGTNPYTTYTLSPSSATDPMIYNQWMYAWANPADFVNSEINVYEYLATKDNKDYQVYTLVSSNDLLGGYYFEEGTDTTDISNATILNTNTPMLSLEEFKEAWNNLFDIELN